MAVLTIDGVTMPTPKFDGIQVSFNKIWSSNTGRNQEGDMVGTLKKIKRKLEVSWNILTPSELDIINNKISDVNTPYPSITYKTDTNASGSFTAYSGDISFTYSSYNTPSGVMIKDVKVSIIEK